MATLSIDDLRRAFYGSTAEELASLQTAISEGKDFAGLVVGDWGGGIPLPVVAPVPGQILSVTDDDPLTTDWIDPAAGASIGIVKARRTSGALTFNSTSWANVDTAIDLVIPAVAGDDLEVSLSASVRTATDAIGLALTVVTIVSGSIVNYLAPGAAGSDFGVAAWYRELTLNRDTPVFGGPQPYTVQAGDISGGNVTLRLRYRVSSSSATGHSNATLPLDFWVKNLG